MEKLSKIAAAINSYAKQNPVRAHMPGHKGKKFLGVHPRTDVTELDEIDNESVVNAAETDLANILGADFVRILTDGATCGILSMLYAAKDFGKKIIINRTAHKSVYNALSLFNIEPVIVANGTENGLPQIVSEKEIEKYIGKPDVIGAMLTYPDYFGRTFDIKKISEVVKRSGKYLLIDNAHGNCFKFIGGTAYAGEYADMWVDGVHKTNYTLNQGAVVCAKSHDLAERLKRATGIFSTTSPSYIIAASVEHGIKYNYYNKDKLCSAARKVKDLGEKLAASGIKTIDCADPLKLTIDMEKSGLLFIAVQNALKNYRIAVELINERYILFMFSSANRGGDYKKVFKAIIKAKANSAKIEYAKVGREKIEAEKSNDETAKIVAAVSGETENGFCGERVLDYLAAVSGKSALVPVSEAVGKICAENFGVFPPCYPLAVAGERITPQVAEFIEKQKNTFGITDKKIRIVYSDE